MDSIIIIESNGRANFLEFIAGIPTGKSCGKVPLENSPGKSHGKPYRKAPIYEKSIFPHNS
jgi:hypothetical protein